MIARRLSERDRINIASAEDTALFDLFLDQWLESLPSNGLLELDVSGETLDYEHSIHLILDKIKELKDAPDVVGS
jgi:hypothetical protein